MKKVVLSVLVASSLMATSCKKAKEAGKETVNATEKVATEAVKKTEEVVDAHTADMADASEVETVKKVEAAVAAAKSLGIDIPTFDKAELTQNLGDYALYAKDYIAAKGNVAQISKLAPKGAELLKKGQELLKGADAATVTKFNTALTALQSKMAPAK